MFIDAGYGDNSPKTPFIPSQVKSLVVEVKMSLELLPGETEQEAIDFFVRHYNDDHGQIISIKKAGE